MTKWYFPAVLAQFNVNYIQYTYEDVIDDVEIVDDVKNQDTAKPRNFTKFVGALTLKEVNDLERTIKDGCGQVDANE